MGRRAQPPPSTLEAESSASEAEEGACDVCGQLGARVAVACAGCARSFHLGCLTPPLRRRPVLAHAWKCAECAAQAAAVASPVGRKRALRGKKEAPRKLEDVVDLVSEGEEEEEKRPAKRARRAPKKEAKGEVKAEKQEKAERKESDDFMDDAPLSQLRTPSRGKGQAKKPTSKAKAKRPARAAAKSARQKAAKDDTDSVDDESDSDFVEEDEASTESDDDAYVSDAPSEPNNRRQSKSPAGKQRRAPTPKPQTPARRNGTNGNTSDADSLDLPAELQAPVEEEEEEEYDGPSYFIEYAPNARSKVRTGVEGCAAVSELTYAQSISARAVSRSFLLASFASV